MKKIRRDKPVGVIIHITWKYHKETPCIANVMFVVSLFSSTKLKNRRVEEVLPLKGGLAPVGVGK
jgi:hypothetical protein